MTTKCKYCGLPIKWFTTTSGKKIPVDADSRPYWIKGKKRIVLPTGEVLACEYEGIGTPTGQGYVPHHANCTYLKAKKGA